MPSSANMSRLREGLTTRPIQGVSFTVDSAIAYKSRE